MDWFGKTVETVNKNVSEFTTGVKEKVVASHDRMLEDTTHQALDGIGRQLSSLTGLFAAGPPASSASRRACADYILINASMYCLARVEGRGVRRARVG